MKITFIGPIYLLKINSITLKQKPQSLYWNTTEEEIKPDEEYTRVFGIYKSSTYKTKLADKEEASDYLNSQINKTEKKIIKYMTSKKITRIDQNNEYLNNLNGICSCVFYKEKEIKTLIRKK